MGLIKQSDWLRPRHALRRQYEGEVLDVDDPRMIGRVKCSITGLLDIDHIPLEDLPWCYPQYPADFGDGASGSPMTVPTVGSRILLDFPTESIYHPVYRWRAPNRATRPTDFQSEYPNRHGSSDPEGNKTIINKAKGNAFQEQRIQDGTHTFHDSERSVTMMTDPFGSLVEIDRPNQRLFVKFGSIEITVSPDGLSINTPSFILNSEDALSLLSGSGIDVSSTESGHGIESYIQQIAAAVLKNSAGDE